MPELREFVKKRELEKAHKDDAFVRRIEAAAKAMYGRDLARSKEAYPDRPNFWAKDRPAYAEYAALALAAADAVVTVEWIAAVLRRHQDLIPGDSCRCGWVATIGDSSHARH